MRKLIVLGTTVLLLGLMTATPFAATEPPPNHHVHDCPVAPCTYPHLGTAFFPSVLGQTTDDYVLDPAVCPDSTDKALMPNGKQAGQPLRAGQCSTSSTVIHVRSIEQDQPAPEGWTLVTHPSGTQVIDGVTYVTYFKLTDV
jgi:hypothetical protein